MKKKEFWNYILLGLIGGTIGLQEFYVNKIAAGIFAVLFSWTLVPAFVALIEVIVWLFRGKEEFNKEFNKDKILLQD